MGAQQSRQMLEAASTGNVQHISQLLTAVPVDSTDDDGWTALHFSSWAGRAAVVRELLSHDADVRTKDKVPLLGAYEDSICPPGTHLFGPRIHSLCLIIA